MLHEVVDPHDVGVLDLGEEPPLGHRDRKRLLVAGVQQALEHHPPVGDRPVDREVDPAQTAVRQAAHDLVLAVHHLAGPQLGHKAVRVAALRAEPFRTALALTACPAHRRPAVARLQNRLRSGTSGFSSTAARGSGRGTCGTDTSPAPSRPRAVPPPSRCPNCAPIPTETPTRRPPPDIARESRPDTDAARRTPTPCRDRRDCGAAHRAPSAPATAPPRRTSPPRDPPA